MADAPDYLTLKRNRDDAGKLEVPARRLGTGLVALFLLAGLLNVFGQRPDTVTAAVAAASVKVYAPSHVRGGLYYEARFTIDAHSDVKNAILVLDSGWSEGTTINTIEPSPVREGSRNGNLVLELGHIRAGQTHILFMQLQVNPTNVGRRSQDVALYDGDTLLATIERTVTIFP